MTSKTRTVEDICWEHGCRPAVAEVAIKEGVEPELLDSTTEDTLLWRIGGREVLDRPDGLLWEGEDGFNAIRVQLSARGVGCEWTSTDLLREVECGGFSYNLMAFAVFDETRHGNLTDDLSRLVGRKPDGTSDDGGTEKYKDYMVSWDFPLDDMRSAERAFLALASDPRVAEATLEFSVNSDMGGMNCFEIASVPTQIGRQIETTVLARRAGS